LEADAEGMASRVRQAVRTTLGLDDDKRQLRRGSDFDGVSVTGREIQASDATLF